ncbi:MAG: excinuclease ABC subunit UvrA [Deltaproteobacteria bacterium]|nr:excinuclease ABC subunit UvrA [Deltaproteobacteria bacterium]
MHTIELSGARLHNLKGVSVTLRAGELVAVTGVSGSGKSSLAFDTLYAEAQRRFVESFSPYARQFLERLERPPMDKLEPVAAGVAVDRRAPVKSSRSTVATMADLEPYLAALFLREARPLCGECGRLAERSDPTEAALRAIHTHDGERAIVTYRARIEGTEHYLELRERLLGEGYRRVLVGGEARDLDEVRPTDVLVGGGLDVVVDRLKLATRERARLAAALEVAWRRGDDRAEVFVEGGVVLPLASGLSCPGCGKGFRAPTPGLFSYQSPVGACGSCRGFGRVLGVDWHKVAPDPKATLADGAIRPWRGKKTAWERRALAKFCERRGISMSTPWGDLTEEQRRAVLDGEGGWTGGKYPGVRLWFEWLETKSYKMHVRVMLARYRAYDPCGACGGKRLGPTALGYRVDGLDLGDWHGLELRDARRRLEALATTSGQGSLARDELLMRLGYLERVGLGYLTLDRQARTLSGGEAQRVSLTAALGSSLTGALFVLDEPTVGLHPTDLPPLVEAMGELARRGNAVVVVEHDPRVIDAADRVLELGPSAGREGGALVFDGTPTDARRHGGSTAKTLDAVTLGAPRALDGRVLRVRGARANNLRGVDVALPLGRVVAVCGPSGSGKSTLVEDIVYRAAARALGEAEGELPGAHDGLEGLESLRSVLLVDQAPLGRTSRGNAATYTDCWSRFRQRFAEQPAAELAGLTASHFSFNVAAGRCEACSGEGAETVEMQFLADVRLTCPACGGRRFRPEVLEVLLDGRSVSDVMAMSVREVLDWCGATEPTIARALEPLVELGLDYLTLGQPLSTLSGGEAQRLKLAKAIRDAGEGVLVVLDEPSAGLHALEVERLSRCLRALAERGASVLVVEHDPSVIAASDWVVELGPGAGSGGGVVVFEGTPRELSREATRTGRALALACRPSSPGVVRDAAVGREAGARGVAESIVIRGAREHNLAEVDVDIPRGKLVVVTGPSGSGKSSLAFDVVFAEGQRRFLETLTPYARQFLPTMPKPDVDMVHGVPPSVALEQRTARAGANSTVATVTEIAHYLRLLYAKVGVPHCPSCDGPIEPMSSATVFERVTKRAGKGRLLAPVVRARKGTHLDVFTVAERAGVTEAVVDGALRAVDSPPRLAKTREHTIELVFFKGRWRDCTRDALELALRFGRGHVVLRHEDESTTAFSTERACPTCALAVPELDPRWFSFNTAQGRCDACEGTGVEGGVEAAKSLVCGSLDEAAEAPDVEPCRVCEGARLAPIPRAVRLGGRRYHEMLALSVARAAAATRALSFDGPRAEVARAPLVELTRRLEFVAEVGLGYLSLGRPAQTLSGGEMQRLRLAAQLGSGLTGALYVLDEPTIGLHPRDTHRLLANLRALRDTGSTVLVVEHDAEMIRAADYLVDLGPTGGRGGGRIQAIGAPDEVLASERSPTGRALRDESALVRREKLPPPTQHFRLRDVRLHNLVIDDLRIPAERLCVVAGVSGSGKSTLVGRVLYPAVRRALGLVGGTRAKLELPLGLARAVAVDQAPIGRTSRSVPATFLGIWDPIRKLYAGLPEARMRGFGATRFSFNSAAAGGRCTSCEGLGVIAHEMSFLPDVETVCDACHGARFEPSTLEVRWQGLSIGDVLRLTADEAATLFASHPTIARPLETLARLGVGYLQLGQGSPTLSGGEAQRLKLAAELTATGRHRPTLYVLDEPTTGLHHGDVARLVEVMDSLVRRGDSLVVIEHHPAVIAASDWVVELGPEGGEGGGAIVASGPPEEVVSLGTPTGKVLEAFVGAGVGPARRAPKRPRA